MLEIGCGSGLLTREIAQVPCDLLSIDISDDLIGLAKERIRHAHVRFMTADAHATALPAGSFDRIVGSSCLHHLDVDRALREFYRLLKSGGQILFTEPNMLNPQIALQKNIPILKKWAMDSPDETAFFRNGILKTLRRHGFVKATAVPFDFLHPSIPGPLLRWVERPLLLMERVPVMKEFAGSLVIQASKA